MVTENEKIWRDIDVTNIDDIGSIIEGDKIFNTTDIRFEKEIECCDIERCRLIIEGVINAKG